jgi:hypothetical protein
LTGAAGVTATLPFSRWVTKARAATQGPGLSNPAMQPKFEAFVPNALDPGFIYDTRKGKIKVAVGQTVQYTGLVGTDGMTPVPTTVWGYGDKQFYTWPGRTFEVQSHEPLEVKWENRLIDEQGFPLPYIITGKDNTSIGFGDYTGRSVADTSLHWAYSLHGYEGYTIDANGVPIVAHVHGGHSDFDVDGNPEFFFSPGWEIRGPQWVDKKYVYDNSQPAGTIWYHDHALGITRLNVYAGMAGFYIVRDADDTGKLGNPLNLPAFPYEAAFAIQDRMFKDNGELFYPAFPGDPFYYDFITGEDAELPDALFPGGGPTGLAEFFGDHMLCRATQLPAPSAQRMRQSLLGGAVPRGAGWCNRFHDCERAAPLHSHRQRSGSCLEPDYRGHAPHRNRLAVRHHLRLQDRHRRQTRDHEEHRWRRAVRGRHPQPAGLWRDRPHHGVRRGPASRPRSSRCRADRDRLRAYDPHAHAPSQSRLVRGHG